MPVAWSSVAREYARYIMPAFVPAAEALVAYAGIGGGDRVLDVACGPGTAALAARRAGAASVTGVDYASGMIAVARELAGDDAALTFLEGHALALPLPDSAFDVAISSFGVIFAPDPVAAVAEMARALRPGGRVALLAWLQSGTTQDYYDIVYRHIARHPAPHDPYNWGNADQAAAWLSGAFEGIQSWTIDVPFDAASPEEAWRMLSTSTGRVAVAYRELEPHAQRAFDVAMHRYFTRYALADGRVRWPREALLLRGCKPAP